MKRTLPVVLAIGTFASLVFWAPKVNYSTATLPVVHAQNGCSNATLTGNYLFHYSGFNSKKNNYAAELPIAAVGIAAFDGSGNVTFTYNSAFNGHVGANSPPDSGTYSVNSDCTVTMSDPMVGNTWAGAIVGGGSEWDTIVTTTGYTATMSGKKQ